MKITVQDYLNAINIINAYHQQINEQIKDIDIK